MLPMLDVVYNEVVERELRFFLGVLGSRDAFIPETPHTFNFRSTQMVCGLQFGRQMIFVNGGVKKLQPLEGVD